VTVVIFGHLNRSFYLLTYLLTYTYCYGVQHTTRLGGRYGPTL